MTHEPSEERPWTEDEWERFLQKSEVRSAKFGELFETLLDDPDRDRLIAREMGWDRGDQVNGSVYEPPGFEGINPDDEWEESEQCGEESLRAIPAYARGFDWGLRVHKALQEHLDVGQELDPDDPLFVAFADSLIVAAKIAGGHAMGYEEEFLCGNIVCCKRSLVAADRSVAALDDLAQHETIPTETIQPLLEEGRQVRALVEQHMAQLRSRVWWE